MLLEHILAAFLQGDLSSLIPPAVGSFINGAINALNDQLNQLNPATQVANDLKNWAKNQFENWMPDASELQRIENDIKSLLNDVNKWTDGVVSDINNTVENTLGSGQVPAQTDGGLGQTRDDFTPQGQVPMQVGTLPGMGSDAAGISRGSDGSTADYGGGYGGSGSSGPSQSTPTPIGSSSNSGTANTGSAGDIQPPTASDLGIDPNSGAYIEYQPSQNQVVITYPDGTTETRPWPAE